MTGVYGKLPSYGDYLSRELPSSFVNPWDDWLQAGVLAARQAMGAEFGPAWLAAPPWRFHLRAGACGPNAVAGVLLSSRDSAGREFPLTLAAVLPESELPPNQNWYVNLEELALSTRAQGDTVDALLSALSAMEPGRGFVAGEDLPGVGWWNANGSRLHTNDLPLSTEFASLLKGGGCGVRTLVSSMTHQGTVRSRNEDALVDRGDIGLWAVADGAGGHGAGHIASAAVAAALADLPPGLAAAEVLAQVRLRLSAVHANLQRSAAEATDGVLPATTVVVLMARGEHFACLWVGDSRAYILREGQLDQITRDHSLVQDLVDAGELTPEQAEAHPHANIITRAIGAPDGLEFDKVSGRILPGDTVLLCTDGLFKALTTPQIQQLLEGGGGSEMLVEQALREGARDNVTALVVEFEA